MEDTEEYRAIEAMKEYTPGSRKWACSYAECDRAKTFSPFGALRHLFEVHLKHEVPEEYTKYWCRFCWFTACRANYVKKHQERFHRNRDNRKHCLFCRIAWPAKPKEHKEWCPFNTHEKLAVFRTFNKETFRFDYHGHPKLLDMLCPYPLKPEPTDAGVAEGRLARIEQRSETAGQPEEQVDTLGFERRAAERHVDLLKRAAEIVALEKEITAARRGRNLDLVPNMELGLSGLIVRQRMAIIHDTAIHDARNTTAASLPKSTKLLSDRQRARYFPSRGPSSLAVL